MKNLIALTLMMFIITSLSAQRRNNILDRDRTFISFGGQMELPTGEYAVGLDDPAFGFGGSFLSTTRFNWFKAGVNFTYAKTGKFTDEVFLEQGETFNGLPVVEQADLKVNHKIYRGHAMLRFSPFRGKVQPYFDGMVGLKNYSSAAVYEQGEGRDSFILERNNLENSWATSYGWATGVQVELTRGLFLEGRYEHMNGGNATYINPDSFGINPKGDFEYETIRSRTNSSIIHLGVAFQF